ncbi:MAG: hypothetical protein GY739_03950, partial [Mesoflavibacter sp.]|nr:hypothetical protein [Mesoflavibacter sp.]
MIDRPDILLFLDETFRAKFGKTFRGMDDMQGLFDGLISTAFAGASDRAVCGLQMNHDHLKLGRPALIPFQTKDKLSSGAVFAFFEKLHQSNLQCDLDTFVFESVIVEPPQVGTRRAKQYILNYHKYVENNNRIIMKIQNDDQRCLTRAVACGMARALRNDSPRHKTTWYTIRQPENRRYKAQL